MPGSTELTVELATVLGDDSPPQGDFFYLWESLQSARFLELCLTSDHALPFNSCSAVIEAPTSGPQLELPLRLLCPGCRSDSLKPLRMPGRPSGALASTGGFAFFIALMAGCALFIAQALWPGHIPDVALLLPPLGLAAAVVLILASIASSRFATRTGRPDMQCTACGKAWRGSECIAVPLALNP